MLIKTATWHFMGKEMGKGMLQAIGGVLVYVIVVWIVISSVFPRITEVAAKAIALKSPGLYNFVEEKP